MTIIDGAKLVARGGPPRTKRLHDPLWICTTVAAAEGAFVATLFIAVSLLYHTLFRDVPASDFDFPFYLANALVIGAFYAGFAAAAASRFLNGERRRDATLPFSFFGWTAAFAATLMVAFLTGTVGDLSRVSLTATFLLGIPLVVLMRGWVQSALTAQIRAGGLRFQKIALIGERRDVVDFLLHSDLWRHGHDLVRTLYLEDLLADGSLRREEVRRFAEGVLQKGAAYIVLVGPFDRLDGLHGLITELKRFSLNVVYAPTAGAQRIQFLDVVPIGPSNTVRILRKPLSDTAVLLKRGLDVVGAGLGLLLLSPLLLLVALAIRLDSPGPVIYRQERRGFNGKAFTILKFRSMTVTESGHAMRQAERGDARFTRLGRLLRATSIDELPQLINVLRGDMSLVGPRPHAISHDDALSAQMAEYAHRQRLKPGITGWAQVNGYRGETTTIEQMRGRTAYDLHYIENCSIFLDLWVLILTVVSPKSRSNAF